jgi:hypothetical protein
MAIHKLDIGEFDEIDYNLIAIHTSLEDFRLAYFINQKMPINLSKSKDEVQIKIKEGETHFSRFYYKNEVSQQKKDTIQNLFSNITMEIKTKVFLLPEFKKADYFLKIENIDDTIDVSKIKIILNTIDSISAVYIVDTNQIKSKNNLIF